MITKSEIMLRIVDLEMQVEELDERINKLEKNKKYVEKLINKDIIDKHWKE